MRRLIIFALCIVAISGFNLEKEWKNFKVKYNKKYKDNTSLGRQRKANFAENLNIIEINNQKYTSEMKKRKPAITYKYGIGPFADLSSTEFRNKYKSNRKMKKDQRKCKGKKGKRVQYRFTPVIGEHRPLQLSAPKEFDWRDHIELSPVQDQGDSGNCWAFAAVGSVEAAFAKRSKNFVKYSEQELIDCVKAEHTDGCNGGIHFEAFDYIIAEGITPAYYYPKTPAIGTCDKEQMRNKKKIIGFRFIDPDNPNEEEMKKIIANIGPVVTSMSTPKSIHHYMRNGGVYNNPECNTVESDHYVLIVGYGVEPNGQEYWIIKNSWTNRWGLNGYMKLARNQNNMCHIGSEVFYPIY